MDIYEYFISEQAKVAERIQSITKYIGEDFDEYVTLNIKQHKVDVYLFNKENEKIYLRKAEYKKHLKEIQKAYYIRQLQFDQMYLMAINAFLKKYNPKINKADIIIQNNDEIAKLLFPNINTLSRKLRAWLEENYQSDPPFPEKRNIKTLHGEKVRSKSECMISDAMYMKGIPYRYECKLEIEGIAVHPDFMIMHPKTGEIFIWEHWGKADNQQYLQDNMKKLEMYAKAGYIAGKNLIITTESVEYPLDSNTVNLAIKRFFGI